ncbi:hypothetical protein BO71DRAFT_92348 [Aspergillus ellipticus CBS 707.79]|uniref:Uncharacterized protein n=1 Tax=Aspergillus ellipticus CBS 707.79 TaxID=1448320 RepID=A0A319EGK0_9EURO|nr:hypothetical protein BO71DRAFT_92348 [Aspergillus ellipticus CBS 707.79]
MIAVPCIWICEKAGGLYWKNKSVVAIAPGGTNGLARQSNFLFEKGGESASRGKEPISPDRMPTEGTADSRKSEVRSQKSEVRSQKSEVRRSS